MVVDCLFKQTVQEVIPKGEGTQSVADPVPTGRYYLKMIDEEPTNSCVWCGRKCAVGLDWCGKKCKIENRKQDPVGYKNILEYNEKKSKFDKKIRNLMMIGLIILAIIFIPKCVVWMQKTNSEHERQKYNDAHGIRTR